jgi:hypothetical protein
VAENRTIRPREIFFIPRAVGVASLGVVGGSDVFLDGMTHFPVPDAVMVLVPTGNSAPETLVSQPGDVVDGSVNGVATHVAELEAAIVDVGNSDPTAIVSAHAGHMLPFDPLTASAHALGEHAGQEGMAQVEERLVGLGAV